jgi:peptide/nickel transport system ATP-binding protein
MVMYLGQVAELGPVQGIFDAPLHPYTAALLASMPTMDPDQRTEEAPLTGDPPNPINPPPGCRFHTRCAMAESVCSKIVPQMSESTIATGAHDVACLMHQPTSGHSKAIAIAKAA